jgi:arginase
LSGDHPSALGSLAGLKRTYDTQQIGVVWIDAHADLHSPFSTPSGNIHGMPLAAALAQDNRAFKRNEVEGQIREDWEALKYLGKQVPILKPEHLIYFGVRDFEKEEAAIMNGFQIRNYPVKELRQRGLKTCLDEALAHIESVDLIYLTFDVDALDCDLVSRGTGTPVSKGFYPDEIIQLIKGVQSSGKLVALEVCEINPLLDKKGNRMAEVAFNIISAVFDP